KFVDVLRHGCTGQVHLIGQFTCGQVHDEFARVLHIAYRVLPADTRESNNRRFVIEDVKETVGREIHVSGTGSGRNPAYGTWAQYGGEGVVSQPMTAGHFITINIGKHRKPLQHGDRAGSGQTPYCRQSGLPPWRRATLRAFMTPLQAMKKSAKKTRDAHCRCGAGASYEQCCGRWHRGPQRLMAPDAEHLMRSRYTAFVLNELDYLLETWHASTRPTNLEESPSGLKWLGLQVRSYALQDAANPTVEFVARSRHNRQASRLQEI